MAASVMKIAAMRMKRACTLALLAIGGCGMAAALAENLPDPTRPSIELIPVSGVAGEPAKASPASPASFGLQSVFISSDKVAAIINGQEVRLGEKFGDARLAEVNESCVVLMGPQGRQVLQLFPTVVTNKHDGACSKKAELKPLQQQAPAVKAVKKAKKKPKKRKAKKPVVTCVAPEKSEESGK